MISLTTPRFRSVMKTRPSGAKSMSQGISRLVAMTSIWGVNVVGVLFGFGLAGISVSSVSGESVALVGWFCGADFCGVQALRNQESATMPEAKRIRRIMSIKPCLCVFA